MKQEKARHLTRRWIVALAFAIGIVLVASCPNPLDQAMLIHIKDTIKPGIVILSPADGSSYAATVVVSGSVTDFSTTAGDSGKIKTLSYEIVPAIIPGGEIAVAEDGSFSFSFPTTGFSGPMVINIGAEDWNANRTSASITLMDEGAIPSFAVDPGNGQVVLRWNPVPLAQSYTVYYEKNDILPSEAFSLTIPNATSPQLLSSLVNGNMHVFLLRAHSSAGADNWSQIARAIPLSPAHLAPSLTPEFESILIQWNPVPATDEYEVWKSTTRGGTFINISGVVRDTRFHDFSAIPGQPYYYAVKTASYNNTLSGANSAVTSGFRPRNQRVIGFQDTPGFAQQLAVSGPYAYVADGDGGLRILDISDPESPIETGYLVLPSAANDVAVNFPYAYVTTVSTGLRIIDITAPFNPVERSSVYIPGDLDQNMAVAVHYPYAYIADEDSGLRIIDVSNPYNPVVKHGAVPGMPWEVAVDYPFVYSMEYWCLTVIYVSDPDSPLVLGSDDSTLSYAQGIAVSGDYVYVADGDRDLQIFDVSGHGDPVWVGEAITPDYASSVVVDYPYAYVADGASGVRVINVADPANPTQAGSVNTPGSAEDVAVSGSSVYVADGSLGFAAIDASSPSAVAEVGSIGADAADVVVQYPFAYSLNAKSPYSLNIYNISSPASPVARGSVGLSDFPSDLAVSGSYAYVVETAQRISIVDISDPDLPEEEGHIDIAASGIAVSGPYAYVAAGDLRIVDISSPSAPKVVGFIDTVTTAEDVAVEYPYAYVVGQSDGLHIIDVSSPKAPVEKGSVGVAWPKAVVVRGSYAYVAKYWGGFDVIDISDPANPQVKGSGTQTERYSFDIHVDGSYVYLSNYEGVGLRVFDVSDPVNPVEVGSYRTDNDTSAVDVSGRYAYVADRYNYIWSRDGGIRIIDLAAGQ